MTKTTKNILITIVIAILVFALICIIYQHYSQKPLPKTVIGEGEILPDANSGLENIINDILDENVTEPEEDEKKQAENETESTVTVSSNSTEDDGNQMTPKETKAINLVKKKCTEQFGGLEGIAFNISIQNDGKYLVTVYDTKTTRTITGYIVDVTTEVVTEK